MIVLLLASVAMAGCSSGTPGNVSHGALSTPAAINDCGSASAPNFRDVDGDGRYDYFGNVTLIGLYVDGDAAIDYVEDANGNGQPDQGEMVHFGVHDRCARPFQYHKDVNGDGKLDLAIDASGDGEPDWWLPAGSTTSLQLVLEDVTHDGVPDWTYDHTGRQGIPDTYYDPVAMETGAISR